MPHFIPPLQISQPIKNLFKTSLPMVDFLDDNLEEVYTLQLCLYGRCKMKLYECYAEVVGNFSFLRYYLSSSYRT